MVSCSAYGCFNDSRKKIPGLSFHRYPKNVSQRTLWISRTNRIKFIPSATAALCSAHFQDNCFETMYKNKYLKPGSLPTIFSEHPREVKKMIKAARKKELTLKNPLKDDIMKKIVDDGSSISSGDDDIAENAADSTASFNKFATCTSPTNSSLKKNITSLKKSILQRVESKPLVNIEAFIKSNEITPLILIDATPSLNTSKISSPVASGLNEHVNTLRISILKQNIPVANNEESFLTSDVVMPHILIDATPCSSNSTCLQSINPAINDKNSLRISIENTARQINSQESYLNSDPTARHIIIDASPSPLQSASTTSPTISLVSLHNIKNVSDGNIKDPHLTGELKTMCDASTSPLPWLATQKPLTLKSEILSMRKYADKYRQQISTLQQAKRRIQRRNEILENSIKKLKSF